ncbi:hypothetical protein DL96DRAFT_1819862 [Flagelloscypha sp. PMI_526]|nr:hypothetical protein DL96DRAFT_1819862 [Flagelloscypha sp. PMI_526]
MLELPQELWEKIFSYFAKSEILSLRLVCKAFLRAIPERYLRPKTLDLSVITLHDWNYEGAKVVNKMLKRALLSEERSGQWPHSLRITPHIEFIEFAAASPSQAQTLRMALSSFRRSPLTAIDKMTKSVCGRITSLPDMQTVSIIESAVLEKLTKSPSKSSLPSRCSYLDIIWSRSSDYLTTLEIWVAAETMWPIYCPDEKTVLSSLRILRVRWKEDVNSRAPLGLTSKAPNLEELTLFQPPSLDSNDLPSDSSFLPRLNFFRWVDLAYQDPLAYGAMDAFFQAFSSQLQAVALRTSRISGIQEVLPVTALESLSLDLAGSLFLHREAIFERLETMGHKLRTLVLQCMSWRAAHVDWLFQALGGLPSLRNLTLFLPSYSTALMVALAKSTRNLESLRLVIAGAFITSNGAQYTAMVPYETFASEVKYISNRLELSQWKLRDLAIRGHAGNSAASSIVSILMAISDVVPTLFSFNGSGNMRQISQQFNNATNAETSAIGPTGIGENVW